MAESDAAVDVRGLNKTFRISQQHVNTLKERTLHPFRLAPVDQLPALGESFQPAAATLISACGRGGAGT